jgi:hypothetical protein
MVELIKVMSVLLVAVAMGLALAHALELPGKLRLTKEEYLIVQPIYYPGFTIGGIAEPLGVIATLILIFFMPPGSAAFWLTLVALLGLIGMQLVYWVATHPVNKFWLQDETLQSVGDDFFALDPMKRSKPDTNARPTDWTAMRNRWEYSHVARAGLALISLIALVLVTT